MRLAPCAVPPKAKSEQHSLTLQEQAPSYLITTAPSLTCHPLCY